MEVSAIIAGIDAQIEKLNEARKILGGLATTGAAASKPGRGRPKGSKNLASSAKSAKAGPAIKRKRTLSPEGRKRIAEAMKKRWAERRKEAAAK